MTKASPIGIACNSLESALKHSARLKKQGLETKIHPWKMEGSDTKFIVEGKEIGDYGGKKKPKRKGNFGVDTAEKAKEREQTKLEKEKLKKKLAAEEAKAEALRKKLRAMGQHTFAEAGVKTFKHW